MNTLNNINPEAELNEYKDLVARFFAQKAQKAIDELWDKGVINEETIEQWVPNACALPTAIIVLEDIDRSNYEEALFP